MSNLRTFYSGLRRASLFTALALSGCLVGPDYKEPELPLPDSFGVAADQSAAGETEISLAVWWSVFGDEKLTDLINQAIEQNKNIQLASARLKEARAIRRGEWADLAPGGTVNAAYESSKLGAARAQGIPPEFRRVDVYEAGFDVLWEIDIFGGERRNARAFSAAEEAAEANLDDALRTVSAEVARSYFELRGVQRQLDVARANVSNQSETVRVTETRWKYGEVTELDSAQAKAQLQGTMSTIPNLEYQIEASMRRIAVLLGRNPSDLIPELSQRAELPAYKGPSTLGSPHDLLRRRPDLRAAERRLAAATENVGVAVSNYYPKIEFNGSISVQSPNFGGLSQSGNEAYHFGPSLSWVGLNYRRVQSSVEAAEGRVDQALAEYEQSVLLALEETESSLVQFSKERTRRTILNDAVSASKRAFEIARYQYEAGETDLLSLLTTQRQFLLSEIELAQSDTQVLVSLVGLFKALGGGWGTEPAPEAQLVEPVSNEPKNVSDGQTATLG